MKNLQGTTRSLPGSNRDTKGSENKTDKGGQIILLRGIAPEASSQELQNQIVWHTSVNDQSAFAYVQNCVTEQ